MLVGSGGEATVVCMAAWADAVWLVVVAVCNGVFVVSKGGWAGWGRGV